MNENLTGVPQEQDQALDAATLNEPANESEPVSSLMEPSGTDHPEEGQRQEEEPPKNEPGWLGKKVAAAVSKAVRETEQRMQAQFNSQLAPLMENMLNSQAENLVASGEFKTKERALEYLQLKQAQGGFQAMSVSDPQPQQQAPQRDAQGRFVARQPEPQTDARSQELANQAIHVRDTYGLDVMGAFNQNPEYQQKVLSGEWNFYDVAMAMQAGQQTRRPPSPVRSSNGANADSGTSFRTMSNDQWKRMNENLAKGKSYDLTR